MNSQIQNNYRVHEKQTRNRMLILLLIVNNQSKSIKLSTGTPTKSPIAGSDGKIHLIKFVKFAKVRDETYVENVEKFAKTLYVLVLYDLAYINLLLQNLYIMFLFYRNS